MDQALVDGVRLTSYHNNITTKSNTRAWEQGYTLAAFAVATSTTFLLLLAFTSTHHKFFLELRG